MWNNKNEIGVKGMIGSLVEGYQEGHISGYVATSITNKESKSKFRS